MTDDPIAFLRTEVPEKFVSALAALAADGSPKAAGALEDVRRARGAILIAVGDVETFLLVEDGTMRVGTDAGSLPVRGAFAMEEESAREALALLRETGAVDDGKLALDLAQMVSARTESVLEGQRVEFHVIVKDLPDDREDAVVKVGFGVDTPPETPTFTATISYDDLEDLRAGDLTPQQIVGRLRLRGDASRAMQLAMKLMKNER